MIIRIGRDYYLAEIINKFDSGLEIIKKNKLPLTYYSHYRDLNNPILSYNFLLGKKIILAK